MLTNFAAPSHLGVLATAILPSTQAVVAAIVLLLLSAGFGTVTEPMNVGLDNGARLAAMLLVHLVVANPVVYCPCGGSKFNAGAPVNTGLDSGAAPVIFVVWD